MDKICLLPVRVYFNDIVTTLAKTGLSREAQEFFSDMYYTYTILPTIHRLYAHYTDTPKLPYKEGTV